MKKTHKFSIGDTVTIQGKEGVILWINSRHEYCMQIDSLKNVYIYQNKQFITLEYFMSQKKYLQKKINYQQKDIPCKKFYHVNKTQKKRKKKLTLEQSIEDYYTKQRKTEDLFTLWARLPGSYGSRQ